MTHFHLCGGVQHINGPLLVEYWGSGPLRCADDVYASEQRKRTITMDNGALQRCSRFTVAPAVISIHSTTETTWFYDFLLIY